jgi:hypothetical protein
VATRQPAGQPQTVLGPLLRADHLPTRAPAVVAFYVVDSDVPADSDWQYVGLSKHPARDYVGAWWTDELDYSGFSGTSAELADYVNHRAADWRILTGASHGDHR